MSTHDDTMLELVAAHALDAVDASSAECQMVREHLRECDICREEYRVASAAATALALSAAHPPPPSLRDRILGALPNRRPAAQIVPMRPRSHLWFVGAAAAAAVLLVVGAWWANQQRQPSWAASCVATIPTCHASGQLRRIATDKLRLELHGLVALPVGKAYQAWVIVPGSKPLPEPIIPTDAQGSGSVDIAFTPRKGTVVAVTVEPAGGSQQPTSKPFLLATVE